MQKSKCHFNDRTTPVRHSKDTKRMILDCPDRHFLKGLSQIVPGARTASKNYYLSHIILLTVRDPGVICESPFTNNWT